MSENKEHKKTYLKGLRHGAILIEALTNLKKRSDIEVWINHEEFKPLFEVLKMGELKTVYEILDIHGFVIKVERDNKTGNYNVVITKYSGEGAFL